MAKSLFIACEVGKHAKCSASYKYKGEYDVCVCVCHGTKGDETEKTKTEANKTRSERAYRMILSRYKDSDFEANIVDALTDIMHLAPDYGDFEDMLRRARMHFDAETN